LILGASEIELIGAVIGLITVPACGFLSWWVKRLYEDNQKKDAKFEALLRECLKVMSHLEILDDEDE